MNVVKPSETPQIYVTFSLTIADTSKYQRYCFMYFMYLCTVLVILLNFMYLCAVLVILLNKVSARPKCTTKPHCHFFYPSLVGVF